MHESLVLAFSEIDIGTLQIQQTILVATAASNLIVAYIADWNSDTQDGNIDWTAITTGHGR